jgi:hypothetical protein
LPCCQQVRKTLARIGCVRALLAVRLPPQVLRAMAIKRIARSAKFFVACRPGQRRKCEQMGLFMTQLFGQPLIVPTAKVMVQQAVQAGFQAERGHRQTMRTNCSSPVTIPQRRLRCSRVWTARGNEAAAGEVIWIISRQRRIGCSRHLDEMPSQTLETPRPVVHQKTRVVLSKGAGGENSESFDAGVNTRRFSNPIPCE